MREVSMDTDTLTAIENGLMTSEEGTSGDWRILCERLGIQATWEGVFGQYVALARRGDLEAVKRALFLAWYEMAEPDAWYNDIKGLDTELKREVYSIVDDLTRRGRLDDELRWMLPYYYSVADIYLPPGFDALEKASKVRAYPWKECCRKGSFRNRGWFGSYWRGIQAALEGRGS
jgi:hypothetical protein